MGITQTAVGPPLSMVAAPHFPGQKQRCNAQKFDPSKRQCQKITKISAVSAPNGKTGHDPEFSDRKSSLCFVSSGSYLLKLPTLAQAAPNLAATCAGRNISTLWPLICFF
jgi:hypothetical protein